MHSYFCAKAVICRCILFPNRQFPILIKESLVFHLYTRLLNSPTTLLSIDQITHLLQPAHQPISFITPQKIWLHLWLSFDCHLSQPFKTYCSIVHLLPALINRSWDLWDVVDLVSCLNPSLKLALPIMWLPRTSGQNSRNIGWMYLGLVSVARSLCFISSNWSSMTIMISCMVTYVYLWNHESKSWLNVDDWLTNFNFRQMPSGTSPILQHLTSCKDPISYWTDIGQVCTSKSSIYIKYCYLLKI